MVKAFLYYTHSHMFSHKGPAVPQTLESLDTTA